MLWVLYLIVTTVIAKCPCKGDHKVVLNQDKYVNNDCSGSVEMRAITTMTKEGLHSKVSVENGKMERSITCEEELFDQIDACTCDSLLSALDSVHGCQNGIFNNCTATPKPAPAEPSCCWDLDETQWKIIATLPTGHRQFTLFTDTHIRSGGNCFSNASVPPMGGTAPPLKGTVVAQAKLGLRDHNRTFKITTTWQPNGTHTTSCASTPGVSCNTELSDFMPPMSMNKLCFGASDESGQSVFARTVSVGGVAMQVFDFTGGNLDGLSALVNVAENCAVAGVGAGHLPAFVPTMGSYYDVGVAKVSPGTFDVPNECFQSDMDHLLHKIEHLENRRSNS